MTNSVLSDGDEREFNNYLTIGELAEAVSKLAGIRCTAAMIYNYEHQGLIPTPERSPGGFRLFLPEDIGRVILIKRWQEEGLSLADIKERLQQNPDASSEVLLPELPLNRREQILEAAARVFPQKGYQETTIQQIAQDAEISSSAIYQYFNSKEELFLALTERISFLDFLEDITLAWQQKPNLSIEDLRQVLIELAEAFTDAHRANLEVMRMFFAEARRFPEIGTLYCKNLILPIENYLQENMESLIREGVLPKFEVKLALHAFFGIFLNFILAEELMFGKDILAFPTENRIAKLVDLFLYGILNGYPQLEKGEKKHVFSSPTTQKSSKDLPELQHREPADRGGVLKLW